MKVSTALRTGMKFVTPRQYAASKEANYTINSEAVNQFTKMYSPLNNRERVLDFGCATGETTNAMARGELGNLGKPESVIGTDVSQFVDHCRSTYSTQNLTWKHCDDVESKDWQKFAQQENNGKMDLITSFSYLHWVQNQPKAVQMFNKMLNNGGKFCFVIPTTQNQQKNTMRNEFESMKRESQWSKMLNKTTWPHFKTVHKNNSWMTTVDNKGNGPITERDYVKLMENNGFKVDFSQNQQFYYVFNEDFMRNFFKSNIRTCFNELQEKEKEQFMEEFVRRMRSQKQLNSEGHYEAHIDGFVIMGEKQRDIL